MRRLFVGLLLVPHLTRGLEAQGSCQPGIGPPRSTYSRHSGDAVVNGYKEIPHAGELPGDDVWDDVVVEWQDPQRVTAGCIEFRGRLLVQAASGLRPVDWFQGIEVLVGTEPDVHPDWSGAGPFERTASGRGLVEPDGAFFVGVRDLDWESQGVFGHFQVGIRLAHMRSTSPEEQEVRWSRELPLLEPSVSMVEYRQPPSLSAETFQRKWNARSKDATVHRGPLDEPWSLLPVPRIAPIGDEQSSRERRSEAAALIDDLADVSQPGAGYSATMSGNQFLPVPRIRTFGSGLILGGGHGLGNPSSLERLEALGPDALPALLDHLDDERPTGVRVTHDMGFGGMWFENRVAGNPLNDVERELLGERVVDAFRGWGSRDALADGLDDYTVKVGDLCFVAIGQIVNRSSYRAVQYQPSGNQVICGMARYPEIVEFLRNAWSGIDPRQLLLDWLLIDFHTRGTHTSELQAGAATRLAYYFPEEATPVLVRRLDGLVFEGDWNERQHVNGMRPASLVSAVSFSESLDVQLALLRILQRTEEPSVQSASFRGDQPPGPAVRAKLGEIVDLLPDDGLGAVGRGYRLLWTIWRADPDGARELFEKYLEAGSVERKHSLCLFLQRIREPPAWAADLLRPLLDDRRETAWFYAQRPHELHPTAPILVRDEAAMAIARCVDDLSLELVGTRDELDRRIEAIRARLDSHDR